MENQSDHQADTDPNCAYAISVVSDKYRSVLVAECAVAFLAIIPNLLVLSTVWKATIFPSNLRLLLAQISFVLIWVTVGDLVKNGYTFFTPVCSYEISLRNCRILDLCTTSLALPNLFYSVTSLCIERLYATLFYKKYDKKSSSSAANNSTSADRPWLAFLLILIAWTTSGLVNGNDVWTLSNEIRMPICESSLFSLYGITSFSYLMLIYLIEETLCALITIFIYFYNRYVAGNMVINRARYDLSARFRINQNVQVNAMVVPMMTLHYFCHLPTFIIFLTTRGQFSLFGKNSAENQAWISRLTYLLRLIYAVIHPALVFRLNFHMRQQLKRALIWRVLAKLKFADKLFFVNKIIPATTAQITISSPLRNNNSTNLTTHFNYIDKMWTVQSAKTVSEKNRKTAFGNGNVK